MQTTFNRYWSNNDIEFNDQIPARLAPDESLEIDPDPRNDAALDIPENIFPRLSENPWETWPEAGSLEFPLLSSRLWQRTRDPLPFTVMPVRYVELTICGGWT